MIIFDYISYHVALMIAINTKYCTSYRGSLVVISSPYYRGVTNSKFFCTDFKIFRLSAYFTMDFTKFQSDYCMQND